MANEFAKFKNSARRHKTDVSIARQVKIAKAHGAGRKVLKQPHRLAKHHAMDCGVPNCPMCSNPRHNKTVKDHLTIQEKRDLQKAKDE